MNFIFIEERILGEFLENYFIIVVKFDRFLFGILLYIDDILNLLLIIS